MNGALKLIRVFIISCLLVSFGSCQASTKNFPALKSSEKRALSELFHDLFIDDVLGYTLFGNKPIYWTGVRNLDFYSTQQPDYKTVLLIHENVHLLKKLHFRGKNFHIGYRYFPDTQFHRFVFINKKALKKTIKKNLFFLQKRIGKNISASEIYREILENGPEIYNGQAVFGIFLGYGTKNSSTWEDICIINEAIDKEYDLEFLRKIPNSTEEIIEREYQALVADYCNNNPERWGKHLENLQDYANEYVEGVLLNFSYHSNSKESKEIIKDYKKAQKKINKLLKNKHFLDKVLRRLES